MPDHDAWKTESIDCGLKRWIDGHHWLVLLGAARS
jgi:hypothetical protein